MNYYIIQEDQTKGPYTISQIKHMWLTGALTGNTLHCREGDLEWSRLDQISHLLDPDSQIKKSNDLKPAERIKNVIGFLIGVIIFNIFLSIYRNMIDDTRGFQVSLLPFSAIAMFIYFLPTLLSRQNRNARVIFILNALLGWTLVGWVVALIWACFKENPKRNY